MHLTGTDNGGISIIWLYGDMALNGYYDEMWGLFSFLFFSFLDNYGFLWARIGETEEVGALIG